jgi:hypothetical protein
MLYMLSSGSTTNTRQNTQGSQASSVESNLLSAHVPLASQVKHFDFRIEYADGTGEEINRSYYFQKLQSVIDLLPFCWNDGELLLAVEERIRPVLSDRKRTHPDEMRHNGIEKGISGGYIDYASRSLDVRSTIESILAKLTLSPKNKFIQLGTRYYPDARLTPEHAIAAAVETNYPEGGSVTIYGEDFEQHRTVSFIPLQDYIDRCFSGDIPDIRALVAVVRLAEKLGIDYSFPREITEQIKNDAVTTSADAASLDELRLIAGGFKTQIESVEYRETDSAPQPPYLKMQGLEVTNISAEQKRSDPYLADIITSSGNDLLQFVGYALDKDNKPLLALNYGQRFAKIVGRTTLRAMQEDASFVEFEAFGGEDPVWRDLAGEKSTKLLSYFRSPGFNPQKTDLFLFAYEPGKTALPKFERSSTDGILLVKAEDIIELSREGIFHSRELQLAARMLLKSFGQEIASKPSFELDDFQDFMANGPKLLENLLSFDDSLFVELLLKSYYFRKVISFVTNELGAVTKSFIDPLEAALFSEINPEYAVLDGNNQKINLLRFFHDSAHYVLGGVLPFKYNSFYNEFERTQSGALIPLAYEKYRDMVTQAECLAQTFEVFAFKEIEFGKLREILKEPSLAEIFAEAGIEQHEVFKTIYSIQVEGIIPDKIMNIEGYWQDDNPYRQVIYNRLLLRYCVDDQQVVSRYNDWINFPLVSETVLNFSSNEVVSDIKIYAAKLSSILNSISAYSEGINPLKAALAETIQEIRVAAFRTAYASEVDGEKTVKDLCRDLIQKLYYQYQALYSSHSAVHSIDSSAENIAAFYKLQTAVEILQKINETIEEIYTLPNLTIHAKQTFPYLSPLPNVIDDTVESTLQELERRNFERWNSSQGKQISFAPLAANNWKFDASK